MRFGFDSELGIVPIGLADLDAPQQREDVLDPDFELVEIPEVGTPRPPSRRRGELVVWNPAIDVFVRGAECLRCLVNVVAGLAGDVGRVDVLVPLLVVLEGEREALAGRRL